MDRSCSSNIELPSSLNTVLKLNVSEAIEEAERSGVMGESIESYLMETPPGGLTFGQRQWLEDHPDFKVKYDRKWRMS